MSIPAGKPVWVDLVSLKMGCSGNPDSPYFFVEGANQNNPYVVYSANAEVFAGFFGPFVISGLSNTVGAVGFYCRCCAVDAPPRSAGLHKGTALPYGKRFPVCGL